MPLNESASFVAASLLAVLTFSAMQVFRPLLSSGRALTVLGGGAGSLVFLFLLTAAGNAEKVLLGPHSAPAGWAEVVVCMAVAAAAAASVHRVCATTCVLFSLALLAGVHKVSQRTYEADAGGSRGSAAGSGGSGAQQQQGDGRGKKRK